MLKQCSFSMEAIPVDSLPMEIHTLKKQVAYRSRSIPNCMKVAPIEVGTIDVTTVAAGTLTLSALWRW